MRSLWLACAFSLLSVAASAVGLLKDAPESRVLFDHYRVHDVVTEDGIVLKLIELLSPDGEPMAGGKPEIFVHGYTANANFWNEVAPRERARGKRVFLLNWRGHGQGANRSVGANGVDAETDPRMIFDNLAAYDVPAALDFVYKISGRQKVDWVGHSMGGMMMHLALAGVHRKTDGHMEVSAQRASEISHKLNSFTAIGSPVSFEKSGVLGTVLFELMSLRGVNADPTTKFGYDLPFAAMARTVSADHMYYQLRFHNPFKGLLDVRNISLDHYRLLKEYGGSKVPRPMARSVAFNVSPNGYASADGKIDYSALSIGEPHSRASATSTTIISADNDLLAPLKDQKRMVQNRGYTQILMHDTGHCDMVTGRNAATVLESLAAPKSCRDLF